MKKPSKFYVGQAVVCLLSPDEDQIEYAADNGLTLPSRGPIYHVRELVSATNGPSIRLIEIVNPASLFATGFKEVCFTEESFAPTEEASNEALAELL